MNRQEEIRELKPIVWVGSSRGDLRSMPDTVRYDIGYALYLIRLGERPTNVKHLSGIEGGGILEIIEDYNGNTYRAVYTVRFSSSVYVLHVFQKKSKQDIGTPRLDINMIRRRLKEAEGI